MQGDYLTKLMRRLQKTVRTTAPLTGLIRWPAVGGDVDHGSDKTNYPFVFVHGFFGWGRYDKGSDKLTYWGMFSGDLIEKINRSASPPFRLRSIRSAPRGTARASSMPS